MSKGGRDLAGEIEVGFGPLWPESRQRRELDAGDERRRMEAAAGRRRHGRHQDGDRARSSCADLIGKDDETGYRAGSDCCLDPV